MKRHLKSLLLTAGITTFAIPAGAQSALITGLESPFKLGMTASGAILVTEASAKANTGRVSVIDRSGRRTLLVSGLPSADDGGISIGATGVILRGQTLYILIGEGDVVIDGAEPGQEVPNPKGPSSPIHSSLLSMTFSSDPERVTKEFVLTAAHQMALSDGHDVTLDNGGGATATVRLITDFKDYVPDADAIVRPSNPFGMVFDRDNSNVLYVADAGRNSLIRVDVTSGRARTVVNFPPFPNPLNFGPPVCDVVPTSVHVFGSYLLVGYLSGFPFARGVAGAYLIDPATWTFQPFIKERTTVMELAIRDRSPRPQFFVLEFSGDLASDNPPPGQLLQFDSETGRTLQPGLITPVGMVLDPSSGELFVSEAVMGRIVRVRAQ
jgi:hypothetical protein